MTNWEYEWQLVTSETPEWASVANELNKAAQHLSDLGYDVVSIQIMNVNFGFIFYRSTGV